MVSAGPCLEGVGHRRLSAISSLDLALRGAFPSTLGEDALSSHPMASILRDALTALDARDAPAQSELRELPGERFWLDASRLGIRSVFGSDLQGRATFVLQDDDSGYFESPDELSQIGLIQGIDITGGLSFEDVVSDLHETFRERLEAEAAALEALDFDVILEAPLAQAQGITFIGRHRVSIGASADGALWLLTLDEVPVPEELAGLGLHMHATSAEELWQTLNDALKNQDLIHLSLPPQAIESHPVDPIDEHLDDGTEAHAVPRQVTVHSMQADRLDSGVLPHWDEDDAPTHAIPALKWDADEAHGSGTAAEDAAALAPFDFETGEVAAAVGLDRDAMSPAGLPVSPPDESVPPAPPPEEHALAPEEQAAPLHPDAPLGGPALSMPDVGELEFPASAVEMEPVPEPLHAPKPGTAASPVVTPPSIAELPPGGQGSFQVAAASRSDMEKASAAPNRTAQQSEQRLAAVIGDGIASGKTGAMELNAEAFAALGREDLMVAESLEREATILEARVTELRANAKRLRDRHANLAHLFGVRAGDVNGGASVEPELSISDWASGEIYSDESSKESAFVPTAQPALESSIPHGASGQAPYEDEEVDFADLDDKVHSPAPYPEMVGPESEQATQMVEVRASAFASLRETPPEALPESPASAAEVMDSEGRTLAIARPNLSSSLSYERAVDDALEGLGAPQPAHEMPPEPASRSLAADEHTGPQARAEENEFSEQDAELEAALSQDFGSDIEPPDDGESEPEAAEEFGMPLEPDPEPLAASHFEMETPGALPFAPEPAGHGASPFTNDVPAGHVRPTRVALVVDDDRARARLRKHLEDKLGDMEEAPTVAAAHATLDFSALGGLVVIRPKAEDATFAALADIAASAYPVPVLILSSDPRFDAAMGVGLRLELARRAGEVADQVVQGLHQLGVVASES